MDLLSEWRKASDQWNPGAAPYMLEADANWLESYSTVTYHSWKEAQQSPDFSSASRTGHRPHLGLLPGPFAGDMLNASIYVLMTNPGLARDDYLEYKSPALRGALIATLKQERLDGALPFWCLDRQFDWTDAFRYWDRKLCLTIRELARWRGIDEPEARTELGNKLAVIQRFPYHSKNGPNDSKRLNSWPSARLAGEFVRDTVVKRVRANQAIVVVMRRVKSWNQYIPEDLDDEQGVVRSANAGEARSASLRPASRGGSAILRHLDTANS